MYIHLLILSFFLIWDYLDPLPSLDIPSNIPKCGIVTLSSSNKRHTIYPYNWCRPLPEPAKGFLVREGCACDFYGWQEPSDEALTVVRKMGCRGQRPMFSVYGPMSRSIEVEEKEDGIMWYSCGARPMRFSGYGGAGDYEMR